VVGELAVEKKGKEKENEKRDTFLDCSCLVCSACVIS